MKHVLTFDPEGNARCLYTEVLDLNAIGSLEVKRATDVEFDNEGQQWEVRNQIGMVLFADASRATCIEWEHHHFNQ